MFDIETLSFVTFFAAGAVGDNKFLCRCCR